MNFSKNSYSQSDYRHFTEDPTNGRARPKKQLEQACITSESVGMPISSPSRPHATIPIRMQGASSKKSCCRSKKPTKPTVLIACGGTGGHLTPGIALAQRLREEGYAPILVVSQKKIDAHVLENYPQLNWVQIPGVYFSWNPVQLARWSVGQLKAQCAAHSLISKWKPAAVVGFGGFTTLTLGVAAILQGRPLFLHEANHVPGRALRLLSRFAKHIYLPPGITLASISPARQSSATYPLRSEMLLQNRSESRRTLGFPETGRLLVILGGSQGADSLNTWAATHFERLAALGYHIYISTGLQNFKGQEPLEAAGPEGHKMHARFAPFCDTMPTLLSAADFAIARAGAGTIAELERFHVPAILVPYPFAKDNHQEANADYFAQRGYGQKVDNTCLGELMPLIAELTVNEIPWREWKKSMENARNDDPLDLMMRDLKLLVNSK